MLPLAVGSNKKPDVRANQKMTFCKIMGKTWSKTVAEACITFHFIKGQPSGKQTVACSMGVKVPSHDNAKIESDKCNSTQSNVRPSRFSYDEMQLKLDRFSTDEKFYIYV